MLTKYFIEYEALVYNMPECGDFEVLDHKFIANPVTSEVKRIIMQGEDILKANFAFQSCCLTYQDGHISFITSKNKKPLEITSDKEFDDELQNKVVEMVREQIDAMEQYLIFITNVHIFFPVVKINVRSDDGKVEGVLGYCNICPMPHKKWIWLQEGINLERRLHFHINQEAFSEFRHHKCHTRYNRAFDYYIRAFHEYDHSSAFCILCSALDAITGCSNANDTKERLAKYSSVLFCIPLEMDQIREKMRQYYKIRSTFIHGKGNQITVQDEIELREYVRKFLIAYFLFWHEMGIKNEPQMLQKLDEIYEDRSLYVKYVPCAYNFIRLSDEHEKQPNGIIGVSMQQKQDIVVLKMMEALKKQP